MPLDCNSLSREDLMILLIQKSGRFTYEEQHRMVRELVKMKSRRLTEEAKELAKSSSQESSHTGAEVYTQPETFVL